MFTPLDFVKKERARAIKRMIDKGYLASKRVYIGQATCEFAAGAGEVWEVFENALKSGKLKDVFLSAKGCAGRCGLEPMVEIIEKDKMPVKYCRVNKERAEKIVEEHLINGKIIEEWRIH